MILDNSAPGNGGGVYCTYTGVLNNCLISGNSAGYWGGGEDGAQLRGCADRGGAPATGSAGQQ